jgi:hypothetical protein
MGDEKLQRVSKDAKSKLAFDLVAAEPSWSKGGR